MVSKNEKTTADSVGYLNKYQKFYDEKNVSLFI